MSSAIAQRLSAYARLIRLDRPIGTYLVLWPALWALWIAGHGRPDPVVLLVFVAGVFLMRSAGCAINDYADRKVDGHVERTRARPLAAGEIGAGEALGVAATFALIALAMTVALLNTYTLRLALVAGFLAASYPFMKRFTHLPQFYLGLAFAWSVPMAFGALTESVPPTAWWLLAAVILWAAAYDTFYAMVDREDDLRIGVRSTAILFGRADLHIVGLLQLAMLGCLWRVGQEAGLGAWYYGGLMAASLTMSWQHYRARGRDREGCFAAFLNNNVTGCVVFIGIALHYVYDTAL